MGSGPVSKTNSDINRSIVWLESSINDTQEYINAQQLLRTPINHVKTFTDDKECEKYIQSVPKKYRIILIVDGRLGQLIVPRIHPLIQISAIFVHRTNNRNEKWTKNYKKVKGVLEEINELVALALSVQEKQTSRDRFEEPLSINVYNTNGAYDQSTTEQNNQFAQSQIIIDCILRMNTNPTDKNEFISYCKKEYAKNKQQLNIIHEFERDYSRDSALKWYTRNCFLYKLLNKAFHFQNIDLLYLCGFFIRDLHYQLKQLKRNQYRNVIHLYRGQFMPNTDVQQLKNSVGQLVSINSFLSTTPDREVAINFSNDTGSSDSDCQSVLFEIEADPQIVGLKPFGNITSYSYMANEEEVLISLGSIFQIINIHYDASLCIIQLVLCNKNGHNIKPTLDQMKIDYPGKENTNAAIFGIVLAKMGKVDHANRYIQRDMNEPSTNRHVNDENAFNASVHYQNMGHAACNVGHYSSALNCFQKALEIRQKIAKIDDPNVAEIYYDIGNVYYSKGEYKRAIDSYNKALTIDKRAFGEESLKVAASLSKIGSIHNQEGRYSEAIRLQQKALTIREKHLPKNHHMLGQSHANIATIYRDMHHFDLALEHYNIALKIYEKSLPSQHPDIAILYNGLGTIYYEKNNPQQALSYFEKAAAIFHETVPVTHPDAVEVQRNINEIRNELGRQ